MFFHKGPLVLCYALVMWTLFFSQFFRSFFIGLPRICLRAKVRNLVFIICSLLVGIDCDWWIKSWIMKATFSWMKNKVFCPQLSPQKAENHILGLWNFKIFWGTTSLPRHPPPLRKTRLMAHCWYSWLLYWAIPENIHTQPRMASIF